ncbi:hypothetical protein [Agaribacter marinus]|uniref:Uncharacterized protein n=1 Tax=Agaribacter marinus TaxID=1431249 RepID=A0AA37STT1_9ALTE|nr:hypothetical protein [Agaribacter marinus]GLR69726.1 hypothetical protein GCM10007852_06340 [Agaribacter marinus]
MNKLPINLNKGDDALNALVTKGSKWMTNRYKRHSSGKTVISSSKSGRDRVTCDNIAGDKVSWEKTA